MTANRPLTVAVVDQAVRSAFHADLARYLKQACGARFHLYSPSASSLYNQKKRLADVYDSFNVVDRGDAVVEAPKDEKAIIERARYYERRYGIPLGWFLVSDRVYGLGFSPGGFYHPRSFGSETAPNLGVIGNYIRRLDFWEREIKERDIDVVINGFYCEYFAAKANGRQFRSALSARNENFYLWADTCFGELSGLERTFKDAPAPDSTFLLEDAPVLNRKQLDTIVQRSKVSAMLASMMRQTYRHAVRFALGDKSKQYRYASVIASVWREWRVLRRLYAMDLPTVKDLLGKDYVLYALQVEPESNFQGYSPEYFYQLSAIISLARDLPTGVLLAVKEHLPAAGRRPDLFHEQIRLLKNVVFVDPRESGLELARNARAVATINGTVGQEAAILGKPVITFGRRNLYNILPHVKVIHQEEEVYQALIWALSDDFDAARAAIDGQRYLAALRSHCFAMDDFGFHNPKGYTPAAVAAAVDQLLKSLGRLSDIGSADGGAARNDREASIG
jgi:hypothetical protein